MLLRSRGFVIRYLCNINSEGEELIIPGNRQEMLEFIEEGTRGSRLQLDINLPCVSVQIPSKRVYELLYNRFNTDLFLWEPSAPKPRYMTHMESHVGLDLASTLLPESTSLPRCVSRTIPQYLNPSTLHIT